VKLDPGLCYGFFCRDQCELCEPVVKAHLLAVKPTLDLKTSDLSANANRQAFNITKFERANSAPPFAHGFHCLWDRMAKGVD
jgi:hypothetical protein